MLDGLQVELGASGADIGAAPEVAEELPAEKEAETKEAKAKSKAKEAPAEEKKAASA